jgi:hypothetical protein
MPADLSAGSRSQKSVAPGERMGVGTCTTGMALPIQHIQGRPQSTHCSAPPFSLNISPFLEPPSPSVGLGEYQMSVRSTNVCSWNSWTCVPSSSVRVLVLDDFLSNRVSSASSHPLIPCDMAPGFGATMLRVTGSDVVEVSSQGLKNELSTSRQ